MVAGGEPLRAGPMVGLVHGVNTRPQVCWVSSARGADAREAHFLVECDFKNGALLFGK